MLVSMVGQAIRQTAGPSAPSTIDRSYLGLSAFTGASDSLHSRGDTVHRCPQEEAMPEEVRRERHQVTGEKLLQTVKRLVHEGNIRRVIIKDEKDRSIVEIPLTIGVVGAALLPAWVAIGAIAALAADLTIEVERVESKEPVLTGTPEA
jgi:hypothetical protein